MGRCFAVSAIQCFNAKFVVEQVVEYCRRHGVQIEARGASASPDDACDAVVFPPRDCAWTRILWPTYSNRFDFALCCDLAAKIDTAASTIHVYDGIFWEHLLVDPDGLIHRFSSWPHYFAENDADAERLKQEWKGDVTELSILIGIPPETVAGYMVHMPISQGPPQGRPPWWRKLVGAVTRGFGARGPIKAYPDDNFALDDIWVFTDFWKRMGIPFPDPANDPVHEVLRLDPSFVDKLPS